MLCCNILFTETNTVINCKYRYQFRSINMTCIDWVWSSFTVSGNKLKEIKPWIAIWTTLKLGKFDVILTPLRIGHSRLTHTPLLFAAEESICPYCYSSVLTIRHILTDCLGLRHMYRHYFHSSSPKLKNLLTLMWNSLIF